jgi:DNA invertase Pin-like site-specific DNA recombinase
MGRAVIYCRISSDREGRALGVERQEEDCKALAERLGHTIVRVFKDNDAGASRHSRKARPAFAEMTSLAGKGHFDVIIAWSTGRLTRRPMEHELLIPLFEEHKILIQTVKAGDHDYTTARGRRRAREDAARDAEEVEEQAERIRRQKIQAAMSGQWRGGRRPYGYGLQLGINEKTQEPILDCDMLVPDEAAAIAYATRELLAGASLRALAAELNETGQVTSTGRPWTGTELRKVLRRARNAGLVEIEREDGTMEVVAKAAWPAIVSEEEWRAVVAVLSDPSRRTNQSNVARRWLGSGLYRCSVCGSTVRATKSQSRGSEGVTTYRCSKRVDPAQRHPSKHAALVDEVVTKAVLGWLARPVAARRLQRSEAGTDIAQLRAEATNLRRRLDEADDMFAAGELDRRRLAKIAGDVRAKLADVEAQLADASPTGPLTGIVGAPDIAAAWEALDVSRRQAVVDAICEVELLPSPKGRPPGWKPGEHYFDPRSVKIVWRR